jgi:prepilin-type N-terminal cleavage/methylation domain-containing protein
MRRARAADHPISSRRRTTGFTMVELVIALAVLGFGVLGAALMQARALTEGSRGRHMGDAAAVARSYLAQIDRLPWTALDAVQGAGLVNPNWTGATTTFVKQVAMPGGGTATEQTYTVQWSVTNVAPSTCLRDIQVQVQWNEQQMAAPRQLVLSTRRYNWVDPNC